MDKISHCEYMGSILLMVGGSIFSLDRDAPFHSMAALEGDRGGQLTPKNLGRGGHDPPIFEENIISGLTVDII